MKNKHFMFAVCFITAFFLLAWGYTRTYSGVNENIKPDMTREIAVSSNAFTPIQLSDDAKYPAPVKKLQKALSVAVQDNGSDISANEFQPSKQHLSGSTPIKNIDELQKKLNNLKALTGNN